jgi:hypothetical protein
LGRFRAAISGRQAEGIRKDETNESGQN